MNKRCEFLGLQFDLLTLKETINIIDELIEKKNQPYAYMLSPTAELIVRSHRDKQINLIYRNATILTADGYVVYYAARICGVKIPEPVSASRLMFEYLPIANSKHRRIYLLGATQEVIETVVKKIKSNYSGINIVGYHNGYFDINNDSHIARDIIQASPDIVFVAMTSPLKEKFIYKNINNLPMTIMIGVGGAFDIIAGKTKLAPLWISKCGFEWFWRLIQEPRRLFPRYFITNTLFLWLLFKNLLHILAKKVRKILL